jgi:hypothetical protein
MKKLYILIGIAIALSFPSISAYSQCDPLSSEQCPDPENNGQVCPDSLEPAFLNQFYSQVATIKTPAVYYQPPDSTAITLHHVQLVELGNLPPGITWLSDSPDSNFIAGEYNCVLMEGQPESAGLFPLRIKIDVYVVVFPGFPPVKVATVTDSTSLNLLVIDDSGTPEGGDWEVSESQNFPNPFRTETRIPFIADRPGEVSFNVYTLMGQLVHQEEFIAEKGENEILFNGRDLPEGSYYFVIRTGNRKTNGIMLRAE